MTINCPNLLTHAPSSIRYLAFSIPFLGGYACCICRLLQRCCLVSGRYLIDSLPPRFLRLFPHCLSTLNLILTKGDHRKLGSLLPVPRFDYSLTIIALYYCFQGSQMDFHHLTRAVYHIPRSATQSSQS